MENAIEVKELTKFYGNLLAVDHVNFEVKGKEIFGLLGPNGAGKTTTIRMICGMLRPTSGTAVIAGFDISPNHKRLSAEWVGSRHLKPVRRVERQSKPRVCGKTVWLGQKDTRRTHWPSAHAHY